MWRAVNLNFGRYRISRAGCFFSGLAMALQQLHDLASAIFGAGQKTFPPTPAFGSQPSVPPARRLILAAVGQFLLHANLHSQDEGFV